MSAAGLSEEQSTTSMKKQLVSELWTEVKRAAEVLDAARSENQSLRQNLTEANLEIERLKAHISDLDKMLTSRETTPTNGFDEREKAHFLQTARELIARIDKQLSLF